MGIGEARTSYEAANRTLGGNFLTNDDTLLSFTLWGRNRKIKGWEKYEGLPFPERMLVGQRATQGGRMPEGENSDYVVIQYTFQMRSGIPECVHIDVESQYGTRGVRDKDVKYIKIDDVLEATLNHLALWQRNQPPPPEQRRAAVSGLMRSRRITITDDLLLEVARIYEENIAGAPTQAVADFYGISKSAADKRVKRARDAGCITKVAKSGRRPQK